MMRVPARVLIQDLLDKTDYVLNHAQQFLNVSDTDLHAQPNPNAWSIAQCLEHLMLYNDYYIPYLSQEIEDENNRWRSPNTIYKAGLLGDYFARSMVANEKGKIKNMSAPKAKNPFGKNVRKNIVDQFLAQQIFFKDLIHKCDTVNLNKGRIPITIMPFIKLSVGDTLRFVTYHNCRHIDQALSILKNNQLSQEL